jgi:hypothetical protein
MGAHACVWRLAGCPELVGRDGNWLAALIIIVLF